MQSFHRIVLPLLMAGVVCSEQHAEAVVTQSNAPSGNSNLATTSLDNARKQCQDDAYRTTASATRPPYAAMTTCGTTDAELRYRIFLRLYGNLMRIKLQTLDASLKISDDVHAQVDEVNTLAGNIGTLVTSIRDAHAVDHIDPKELNEEIYSKIKDLFVAGAENDKVTESWSARDARLQEPLAKVRSTLNAFLDAGKGDVLPLGIFFFTTTVQTTNDFFAAWKTSQVSDARLREVAFFDAVSQFLRTCQSDVAKFAIPQSTSNADDFRGRMSDAITRVVRAATYQSKACESRIICGPNSSEALACTVVNGSGTQSKVCSADGRGWTLGVCGAIRCNSGYVLQGTTCVQPTLPSLASAILPVSATTTGKIFLAGSVTDARGLAGISMLVSGPRGNNVTAFTDSSASGTSKSLTGYYFDGANSQYAGVPGTYTVTLTARNTSGQSASKTFTVLITDSAPLLSTAGLVNSTSRSAKIYFTGEATDDTGLGAISVIVSGPRKSNFTAFTDTTVSGKVKSLSGYYFDPSNSTYAGVSGTYSIVLRVQDRSSQVTTRTFPVIVR